MVAATAQPVKYQGVDKESSGYKLLAAMGWQEGSGLVRGDAAYCACAAVEPANILPVAGGQAARYQGARKSQEEA